MRRRLCMIGGALVLCAGATAVADIAVGFPFLGGWQPPPTALGLNGNGAPFWDGTSSDPPPAPQNIGYYLAGIGQLNPWWGLPYSPTLDAGGANAPVFFMKNGTSNVATLKIEYAALAGSNEFGWFDMMMPAVLHPIILGPAGPGTVAMFSPSPFYAFYLRIGSLPWSPVYPSFPPIGGPMPPWFKGPWRGNFAVFQDSPFVAPEDYWIGIEDIFSDSDFQDLVVRVISS